MLLAMGLLLLFIEFNYIRTTTYHDFLFHDCGLGFFRKVREEFVNRGMEEYRELDRAFKIRERLPVLPPRYPAPVPEAQESAEHRLGKAVAFPAASQIIGFLVFHGIHDTEITDGT